ncbi:MAG: hypothetical protein J6O50_13935 [Ruminiclostridium sp.]|nr:hypothetical protein [Ruminiclostridium sp.]
MCQDALFTNSRLDRTTIPEGLYAYDLRDECDGNINELKEFVLVNHLTFQNISFLYFNIRGYCSESRCFLCIRNKPALSGLC